MAEVIVVSTQFQHALSVQSFACNKFAFLDELLWDIL